MQPADPSSTAALLPGSSGGPHLPLAVLRQYVAGALPAAEQHRVEAHTLACPRCADVLEGLAQTDLPTTDRALTDLQARLRARVAEQAPDVAPAVPQWPRRQLVAAVLLLLVGAAVWLGARRFAGNPAAAPQVALQLPAPKPEAESKPGAASTAPTPAETTTPDKAVDAAPVPDVKQGRVASAKPSGGRARATQPAPVALADANESLADATAAYEGRSSEAAGRPTSATDTSVGQLAQSNMAPAEELEKKREANKETARAKKSKSGATAAVATRAPLPPAAPATGNTLDGQLLATPAPAGTRVVRGRVTDRSSGTGLPGVTVLAKGTSVGASTAADGSFALVVPEAVKALTFSAVGYNTAEQRISSDDDSLALALAPSTQSLSEVVVRREPPPAPAAVGALPAGGYQAFRAYLKQELEYPEKALKEGKEGSVRLRFVVAADSRLQDIKVVRGLSEECDAEAIRLLQEGPPWFPAILKGRRTARPVEVSVPFRIRE